MSVKESKLEEIMSESGQNEQKVQKILNILLEAPYFYRDDDLSLFLFLSKYKRAFAGFFKKFYGWELIVEYKCARLYKPAWYNEKVTEVNRDMFNFTKRDECVAFLLLLEFFERELQEQARKLYEQEAAEKVLSRVDRMLLLSHIARDSESDKARISAVDTLNKMDGVYVNKVEVASRQKDLDKMDDILKEPFS